MSCQLISVLLLTATCLIQPLAHAVEDTQIVLVQAVFRHGDRTPTKTYPNNPVDAFNWDKYGGLGQLTQIGMNQAYNYGGFLRTFYSKFLSDTYDRNLVCVRSTDYDRTIMTAQSLLAGLYEPHDDQLWSQDITWQPVPVHTKNYENLFGELECKKKRELMDEFKKSSEINELKEKYKSLFALLNEKTGQNNVTLDTVEPICDNTYVQRLHHTIEPRTIAPLPDWLDSNFDKLLEVADSLWLVNKVPEVARLTTGALLADIRSNMLKTRNEGSKFELFLYSGHDKTIVPLSQQLSTSLPLKYPPYLTSIVIEFRRSVAKPDDYFVQVLWKNNTASDKDIKLHPVVVDGCESSMCPFETFMDATKNKIAGDLASECAVTKQDKKPRRFDLTNVTFLLGCGSALGAALFVIVLALISFRHIIANKLTFSSGLGRRMQNEYKFERINLTVGDIDEEVDDDDEIDGDDEIFDKNRLVIQTKQ